MELRTWERKNYTVEMVEHDHDLKAFEVVQGDKVQTIYPATIEDMQHIINDLDNGEDVNGWEDGNGNTIVIEEETEMENYDLRNYGYGVGSEIQVENGVIEELARFYGWDENKIQRHIESDIVEILEELEEDGKYEESISFAKEDNVTGSYEVIEFEAIINKKGDDVTVTVK